MTNGEGLLANCDAKLPLDLGPQRVDFKQFVLFAKPYVPPETILTIWPEQEYAILQPHLFGRENTAAPPDSDQKAAAVAEIWRPVTGAEIAGQKLQAQLIQDLFPGPYKPITSDLPHFALCVTLSQTWLLVGYRRG